MDLLDTSTAQNEASPDDLLPPGREEDANVPTVAAPPQISSFRAILTAPFRPRWVAERTVNLPLKRAWLIHFVSVLTTFAVISLIILWAEWPSMGPISFAEIMREITQEFDQLKRELLRSPIESVAAVLGIITLVEGGHLAIALLLMAWGARDEPLKRSFGFAVRQVWLSNSRVVLGAIIIGVPMACIEHENRLWRQANPGPERPAINWPPRPSLAKTDPAYAKEIAKYKTERKKARTQSQTHWDARQAWLATRPWYLQREEVFGIPLGFLTGLWFLWALFRSIGATRNVPPIIREQRCIECGYNLHTIPMESRCPECGKPILETLGPDAHPGSVWQNRTPTGTLAAWWTCAVAAVRNPKTQGQMLQTCDPGTAHRSFLAINLVLIWLVAVGGVLSAFALFMNPGDFENQPALGIIIPTAFATFCAVAALVGATAAAMLVGLSQSLAHKRNLFPSAMQVASHLSGFLVAWAAFGAVLVISLIWMDQSRVLRDVANSIGIYDDVLGTLFIIVPNLACAAFYFHRLSTGTAATRFANK